MKARILYLVLVGLLFASHPSLAYGTSYVEDEVGEQLGDEDLLDLILMRSRPEVVDPAGYYQQLRVSLIIHSAYIGHKFWSMISVATITD